MLKDVKPMSCLKSLLRVERRGVCSEMHTQVGKSRYVLELQGLDTDHLDPENGGCRLCAARDLSSWQV